MSLMIPGNFLASCVFFCCVSRIFLYIKRQSTKSGAAFILYIQLLKLQFPWYIYILGISFSCSSSLSSEFATLISNWVWHRKTVERQMSDWEFHRYSQNLVLKKMDQHFNRYWFQIMSDMLKTWHHQSPFKRLNDPVKPTLTFIRATCDLCRYTAITY